MSLKTNIISTVVGGLILSFVLWLVGVLTDSLGAITWLLGYVADLALAEVAVPVRALSLIVVTVLVVLACWRRGAVSSGGQDQNTSSSKPAEPADEPQLSELEDLALRVLAETDGGRLPIGTLAERCASNRLRTERAVDGLVRRGLVERFLNTRYGEAFALTARGRNRAIDEGYA